MNVTLTTFLIWVSSDTGVVTPPQPDRNNANTKNKAKKYFLQTFRKDKETIRRNVRMLFERYLAETSLDIRRVGVRVASFSKEEPKQKSLTSFFQN